MTRLLSRLHTASLYPLARLIVAMQSLMRRLRVFGQRPTVHFETQYAGERLVLLALYQKGALRPDVIRFLQAARSEGLYLLVVNTLKLRDPQSLKSLVGCYIERPNFGRDFGSYKTGFLHVFGRGWHETCPRLLMINDSIYFSEERMPKFLSDMTTSQVEVLGSTENYEIEHHLGSFCIAMAQSVLKKPLLQKYWRDYRLSDVRPTVIKNGEMKLSRVLKGCVTSPDQWRSLYSSSYFLQRLKEDPNLANFVIKNSRTSSLTSWERFSAKNLVAFMRGRFIEPFNVPEASQGVKAQTDASLSDLNEEQLIQDVDSLKSYIVRNLRNSATIDQEILDDSIVSVMMKVFMSGSQIHQNAATLLHLGLPIVKLDGMYRGMFNVYDVRRMTRLLKAEEATELERLLMERPYGGITLIGWKRAAFMVGLI